ncbi:dehalogenase [Gordonia spumicola]|uniref:Dehalogenase n=1 Tax=Gordonia spumicola TaxID=589161 RepID=A0A7I9V5A0_9ACTN|nr:alpha/beta hydrolase [Gordonia spumicola]GEE00589.1 dehalogenase [Gordonia spumicola]
MIASPNDVPVVLLHGWPVTQAHWRYLLPALDDAGFAPIPVTLPGLGEAPGDVGSFRKHDLAAWVGDRLGELERFAVVGHDWGATVAVHLVAAMPDVVTAVVVEEETLPGVDVAVPEPGAGHYPSWHGPFNRVPGLAEQLVPEREDAYYGSFLRESAGPAGLDPDVLRSYIDAYRADGVLEAGLGYYRTRAEDVADVARLMREPIGTPVLAIGGRYAMGSAVAEGMREVASDVSGVVVERSGHYPAEQEPEGAAREIISFLRRQSADRWSSVSG